MISVTTYGAVGSGLVDDAPAIQAALAAEGWAYVPGGTYRLDSLLRSPARRKLTLSPDAVLLRNHDGGIITNTPTSGGSGGYAGYGSITIEGGTLDMAGTSHTAGAAAIAFAHATGITIRDLTVLDVPGWHAVECNSSKTVRITDCRFAGFNDPNGDRGTLSEAIQIDISSDVGYPIGGPWDGTPCNDVKVQGCWFGASETAGTMPWPRGVGSHGSGVTAWHTAVKVLGNTFEGTNDAAVATYGWDGATIAHNHIYSPGGEGIAVRYSSRYIEVDDNQVFDAARSGIWVNTDCTQVGVTDNFSIGSGTSTNNAHYGVRVSTGCSWVRVVGNTVRKRASGNHARYGLSFADGTSMLHYGNDLRGSGVTGNLQDLSTSPVTSAADAT